MPRAARIVAPGTPHHITQRGNRQQAIFFSDADRHAYLTMLGEMCRQTHTRCLGWCLMTNHVHLILVPATGGGLRAVMASVHTRYAQRINRMQATSGHLFQGRYASYIMDDAHLMAAIRYVENNPVVAGLVRAAGDWRWSSARAHLGLAEDSLTEIAALGQHVPNWRAMLEHGLEAGEMDEAIEASMRTGRPLGSKSWRERVLGLRDSP